MPDFVSKEKKISNIIIEGTVIEDKEAPLLPSSFIISDIKYPKSSVHKEPKSIQIWSLINTARLVRNDDRLRIKGDLFLSKDKGILLVDTNFHEICLI